MSRQLTALTLPAGVTYCSRDGVPYRADWSGIVHVEARHITEITAAASGHASTAAEVGATHHRGTPLVLTVEA